MRATVQRIRSVILRDGVLLAIQHETRVGDAVGIATDDRAKEGAALLIVISNVPIEIVEPQHDILARTLLIGNFQRNDDSAIVGDARLHLPVRKCVEFDGSPVRHFSKRLAGHFGFRLRKGDIEGNAECGEEKCFRDFHT